MSRRSQATRRRNYGRRQHEVRERRDDSLRSDWSADLADAERPPASRTDEGHLPGGLEAGLQ